MKNKLHIDGNLAELIRPSKSGPMYMHEQELNFDAGYTPPETPMKFIREEMIDGKRYRVYQQWSEPRYLKGQLLCGVCFMEGRSKRLRTPRRASPTSFYPEHILFCNGPLMLDTFIK